MDSLADNRRARFDYAVLESYEAGIKLEGHEVKSVKSGRAGLSGAHAIIRGGEAWLLNANIAPYQANNAPVGYDPTRTRRLLLAKSEIAELTGKLREKGVSLIPMRLYANHGIVKVELALARARKAHDKREVLKKRSSDREMRREE